jgi:hypothetical protein
VVVCCPGLSMHIIRAYLLVLSRIRPIKHPLRCLTEQLRKSRAQKPRLTLTISFLPTWAGHSSERFDSVGDWVWENLEGDPLLLECGFSKLNRRCKTRRCTRVGSTVWICCHLTALASFSGLCGHGELHLHYRILHRTAVLQLSLCMTALFVHPPVYHYLCYSLTISRGTFS